MTTVNPGEPATVVVSFGGTDVHFQFGIPRGTDGIPGPPGTPGVPGEVTTGRLNTAIATTSANSNAVADLSAFTVSDPPTQSEVQQVVAKLNELISALRRV